jgi:RHS repeat-associated protein
MTTPIFGMAMAENAYENVLETENKFKFQGQEHQDEFDLNWYQFKWRMHDPATGRFMTVDPLAEDYYYNSPYAFSENKVINGIELEGLEHLSIHVYNVHQDGNRHTAKYQTTSNHKNVGDWKGTRTQSQYNVVGADGNVQKIYGGTTAAMDARNDGINISRYDTDFNFSESWDSFTGTQRGKNFIQTLENVGAIGGIILGGETMILKGASLLEKIIAGAGILSGADDLTKDSKGNTMLEKSIGKNSANSIKGIANSANVLQAGWNLLKKPNDLKKLKDVYNVANSSYSAKQNISELKKDEENGNRQQ